MRNIDLNTDLNKLQTHKAQDSGDYLCARTCNSALCTVFVKLEQFVSHR